MFFTAVSTRIRHSLFIKLFTATVESFSFPSSSSNSDLVLGPRASSTCASQKYPIVRSSPLHHHRLSKLRCPVHVLGPVATVTGMLPLVFSVKEVPQNPDRTLHSGVGVTADWTVSKQHMLHPGTFW